MAVVQDVIRVGTKRRCEVLRSHGAVGCVAVAVQPRPVAFEGLTFSRCLCTDLLGSWSACRPWRWLLSTGRRAETGVLGVGNALELVGPAPLPATRFFSAAFSAAESLLSASTAAFASFTS